jgi:hypothetical protein
MMGGKENMIHLKDETGNGMLVQTKLYKKLRIEIEETLSIGDMGDLLLQVLEEFSHDDVVLTHIKALYDSFYEEMYTAE